MDVRVVLVGALVALTSAPARTQAPTPPSQSRVEAGDASIGGRVIDARTQRPIEGVLIALARRIGSGGAVFTPGLVTQTDADGRYAFEHIAAGGYRVTASHQDYVSGVFGATPQSTTPLSGLVSLERRQSRMDVDFALTTGGRITGRVLHHNGEPLKDARVLATLQFGDGGFTILPNSTVRTNARGEYALSNLPEGRYQVSAMWVDEGSWAKEDARPASGRTASPPRSIYYRGTTNAQQLMPVAIAPGATARNIDIVFPESELLRVSGKIIRGASPGEIEAFVMTGPAVQPITVARDGTFTTPRLRAGRYTVVARAQSDDLLEAAMLSVDLSFDLTDMVLGLTPTGIISGRVITDDGTPVSDEMQVAAVLADEGKELDEYRRDRAHLGPDGTFAISGVFGQRVMRMVGVTAGWKIKRVTIGKLEVSTVTIESGATIDDVLIVLTRT